MYVYDIKLFKNYDILRVQIYFTVTSKSILRIVDIILNIMFENQ